jgi:hypothetical protein
MPSRLLINQRGPRHVEVPCSAASQHCDPARRLRTERRRLSGRGQYHRHSAPAPHPRRRRLRPGRTGRELSRPAPSTAASSAPSAPASSRRASPRTRRSRACRASPTRSPAGQCRHRRGRRRHAPQAASGQRSPSRPEPLLRLVGQRLSGRQPRLADQAVGTATNPIIFTAAPTSQAPRPTQSGLWGGIILLGRAPISDCNTAVPGGSANCQQVIEGTTSSLYGGALPTTIAAPCICADPLFGLRNRARQRAPGPDPRRRRQRHDDRPYPGPQQLGRRHRDSSAAARTSNIWSSPAPTTTISTPISAIAARSSSSSRSSATPATAIR